MPPRHVIIVGGGLAGPALALALSRLSSSSNSASSLIRCTILERRNAIEDKGGVISLAPNAMRVMQMIDLDTTLGKVGHAFDAINIHTDARPIGGFNVAASGVQGLSIARSELHKALVDRCRNVEGLSVRHGAKVVDIEEGDRGATVLLEGGERVEGDIVIGCDGIGSAVRQHILGSQNPDAIYSGFVVIGSMPPFSAINLPPSLKFPAFIYTQHGTFLSFSMDEAQTHMMWAATPQVPEQDRKTGWDEYRESGRAVRDLKEEYKNVKDEPVRSWLENLTNENVWLWAPYTLPDLPTWHSKRICLLGDAAHAFPPSIGQGTAQAFEDVGYLARLLMNTSADTADINYEKIFEQFESTRKPRVDKVRKMAVNAERMRGKTSPPIWWLKSQLMWGVFKLIGNNGYLEGDYLNAYDVTKEPLTP